MENVGDELENDLTSFREQWKEELKVERVSQRNENSAEGNQNNEDGQGVLTTDEARATELFLEGARYERDGQFNIAVYYYRQAVHLVPDIEFKIAEWQKPSSGFTSGNNSDDEDQINGGEDEFQLESITKAFGLMSTTGLCSQSLPQTMTHISVLPTELLVLLFKWVVSKELDVKSLSRLSLVCKWFYVCARDEEIWKQICLGVWGINCIHPMGMYNNCWRRMFVERPHVNFDGVYISTNSYIHIGEPTVGSYYKPCHVVQYYKYLRFFSDGTVLIYTSAEDPQTVVQILHQPPYRDPSIHKGYFRLTGTDTVNVYYQRVTKPRKDVTRGRKKGETTEIREHHFFMNLVLRDSSRKRNAKLMWEMYSYQIKNRKSGETSENQIDTDSFKPFTFSGVRSYLSRSSIPL